MPTAPPYLVVVVSVAVLAALCEVGELRRRLSVCRGGHRNSVVLVGALLAQTLLRPAAWAALAVTGAWLFAMAVNGSVQLSGAAGAVAEPVVVGLAAALVLVTVPRPSALAKAGNKVSRGSARTAVSPTSRRPPGLSRSAHHEFQRWEAELRTNPRGTGTGETGDPLQ